MYKSLISWGVSLGRSCGVSCARILVPGTTRILQLNFKLPKRQA